MAATASVLSPVVDICLDDYLVEEGWWSFEIIPPAEAMWLNGSTVRFHALRQGNTRRVRLRSLEDFLLLPLAWQAGIITAFAEAGYELLT